MSPSPPLPLPLPPSSNDLIKTDSKHSLLPLLSQRCRCHSYTYAASLNEWIGLTGVHVGNVLQSSRCAPVHTDWDVGEERAAYLALNPPSLYSTLRPSLFLSLSLCLLFYSTLPSWCPCLVPTLSPCTKWIPSASSFSPLLLMLVIVWFQQCERERKREREADTARSKTSECIYMGLRESLLWGQDQPPSSLKQAAIGMYQRGINSLHECKRVRRIDMDRQHHFISCVLLVCV